MLALAGCTAVPEPRRAAAADPSAELTIANTTPYAWRIEVRTAGQALPARCEVKPRATVTLRVAPGEAEIDQLVMTPGVLAEARRTVACRFEPAEHYDWTLATLLTAGASGAKPTGPGEAR